MKKQYIIPSTITVSVQSCMICGVGSVHGNSGLGYGGNDNSIDPY